jgi:hypothetical protein
MQQPVFKDYKNNAVRHGVEFHSGQPRYIPAQRLVGGPYRSESVYKKPAAIRGFEGVPNESGSTLAQIPTVHIKPALLPVKIRHAYDPFTQQAPVSHPLYPNATLDLNAPAPFSRSQPVRSKYHEKMNQVRREQHEQVVPAPEQGFLGPRNSRIRPNTIGRIQPISQDTAMNAHFKKALNTGVQHAPNRTLQWRAPDYHPEAKMYQKVEQHRDYRLEKRKQQQAVYQTRREQEKKRLDEMYSKIAAIKSKQNIH